MKRRKLFDIDGSETDLSGNDNKTTLQDDDNTTASELIEEWENIPVSPASADESVSDDAYDHDKNAEEEESEEEEDDDDCVSEASEDRVVCGDDGVDAEEDDD